MSCTGVHGANRLASNSLTESVVAGTRLGRDLAWEVLDRVEPDEVAAPGEVVDAAHRSEIRAAMSRHVGVVRDAESLATAATVLDAVARKTGPGTTASPASWEATNLLTVGSAVVAAAAARTESRGCHRRADHPDAAGRVAAPPRRPARRRRRAGRSRAR